jgi:phage terminase large subunit-like protein
LEDELTSFTIYGYGGGGSPNRADAAIWALAELFPGMVRPKQEKPQPVSIPSLATSFNRR